MVSDIKYIFFKTTLIPNSTVSKDIAYLRVKAAHISYNGYNARSYRLDNWVNLNLNIFHTNPIEDDKVRLQEYFYL